MKLSKPELTLLTDITFNIRRNIVKMIYRAKSGHLGGSLSIVDILTLLYFKILEVDSDEANHLDRDRFVLSKGHAAAALYAVLAERGFFDKELLFKEFRRISSSLQGHPDMNKTPGVDMTSGSLGLGLSVAVGMAIGLKKQNRTARVFTIMGDGEMNEGGIWEAATSAVFYRLDNLVAFVDVNGMQNDGYTKDVLDMGCLAKKWEAFGWKIYEVDGHNIQEMYEAVTDAIGTQIIPAVILCKTIKGKGISFMENSIRFHGGTLTPNEYLQAMKELE